MMTRPLASVPKRDITKFTMARAACNDISRMGQALHIKNGADPPYQEWGRPFIFRIGETFHIKNGAGPPYQECGRPSILRMGQALHIKNGADPPY
jgi:hypothetical protein